MFGFTGPVFFLTESGFGPFGPLIFLFFSTFTSSGTAVASESSGRKDEEASGRLPSIKLEVVEAAGVERANCCNSAVGICNFFVSSCKSRISKVQLSESDQLTCCFLLVVAVEGSSNKMTDLAK